MFPVIACIIVGLVGLFLLVGGVWLAVLGGSLFFILLGLALLVCSFLLVRRRDAALALYGLTLLATVGWSLSEVGLDWWALSARGSLLIVVGLLLLCRRLLDVRFTRTSRSGGAMDEAAVCSPHASQYLVSSESTRCFAVRTMRRERSAMNKWQR